MRLRIAKKITKMQYGAWVYKASTRIEAQRIALRPLVREVRRHEKELMAVWKADAVPTLKADDADLEYMREFDRE